MHTAGAQHPPAATVVDASPGPGGPVRGLLAASHAAPSIAVTAVITALAAASGRGVAGSVLVASAVLAGQLSVGWCNDRIDLRRDLATGRGDKPLVAGTVRPRVVAVAAGCALALCVPLSLAGGLAAGAAHLVGVAAAWSYNLRLKCTAMSWLPYAVAFGLLPAFVTLALPGHPWPAGWVMAAGALLGTGAHVTNVLPDIDDDLRTGIRGLPQRLGPRRARVLAGVLLLAGAIVLVLGPTGPLGTVGWGSLAVTGVLALAVALPTGADPRSRLPFLATLALVALDTALLLLRGAALT
ncbi:UbiA family prenyltransferase [Kitasatospora sp. NPDC008050]|uniref:UbiA family prenyltransferase n=1 Tax=Kitasatospora sp. NPDC008050 TaxID=3364021 RepID=UPI0036EF6B79